MYFGTVNTMVSCTRHRRSLQNKDSSSSRNVVARKTCTKIKAKEIREREIHSGAAHNEIMDSESLGRSVPGLRRVDSKQTVGIGVAWVRMWVLNCPQMKGLDRVDDHWQAPNPGFCGGVGGDGTDLRRSTTMCCLDAVNPLLDLGVGRWR
jgi:hypothetical protein